jgi:peptide deformylase
MCFCYTLPNASTSNILEAHSRLVVFPLANQNIFLPLATAAGDPRPFDTLFFGGMGMIQPIIIIPDERLTTVCKPVTAFDKSLEALVGDLFDTLYSTDGIGLAASQIGVLKNVFVIDCWSGKGQRSPRVFINPRIVHSTSHIVTEEEGCLSIPGVFLPVARPARVGFESRGLRGEYLSDALRGLEARCFYHEFDHLAGILFPSKAVTEVGE